MTDADHFSIPDSSTDNGSEILERLHLLWLDANAQNNPSTEDKLRSVIDRLTTFVDVEPCQTYIEQQCSRDQVVVVVSGQLGRRLVPSIHEFEQVIAIYVYCMDQPSNAQWARRYPKVKSVVTELSDLLLQIASDHQLQRKVDEPLPISLVSWKRTTGKTVTADEGHAIFQERLIDYLLRLESTDTDKNELIKRLQKRYEENAAQLDNLAEFERDYSPEQVLKWYTKKTFFYKALNAVLRKDDIHMIFLFRSYITDIYNQLKRYQSKQPIKVYRCQMMSPDELAMLENAVGQSIYINSFLSTSRDYQRAYSFLRRSNLLCRVVFEVEANPAAAGDRPFADISKHSEYPNEAEILFMAGSTFRLQSFQNDQKRNVSIVKMTLTRTDDVDLEKAPQWMQKVSVKGAIHLRALGRFLYAARKYESAKRYFIRSINELPPNHPLRADLYEDLSNVALHMDEQQQSIQYLYQSIGWKRKMNSLMASMAGRAPGQIMWKQEGITVVGRESSVPAVSYPFGIFITAMNTICVADWGNDRVVQWPSGSHVGEIVADGNGGGRQKDQLSHAIGVVYDHRDNSYVICDQGNRRVVRWFYRDQTHQQILIDDIACYGIAIDNDGAIYVSDTDKHEVRRWRRGETEGTLVAGGKSQGRQLSQLDYPTFLFVDDDHTVYVSDRDNHRVTKWTKGATEGSLVAGGNGYGTNRKQFFFPEGVLVDQFGTVYVADNGNNRIMKWGRGEKCGSILVGGKGKGKDAGQLNGPTGLSFDNEGNLFVVDHYNHRIQKFELDLDEDPSQ